VTGGGQFARVGMVQAREAFGQDAFARAGRAFAVARQMLKMFGQLPNLKQDRPRIFIIQQHEIEQRRHAGQQGVA
jgi:hypothetical protein